MGIELVELKSPLKAWAETIEQRNKYFPMDRAWFAQAAQRDISTMFVEDMVLRWLAGRQVSIFVRGETGAYKSSIGLFLGELQTHLKNQLINRGMSGLPFGLGKEHFDRLGILDYDYRPSFTIKDNVCSRLVDYPDLISKLGPLTSSQVDEVLAVHGMGADISIDMVQNIEKSLRLLQMDTTLIGVTAPEWALFDYLLQPTSTFNHAEDFGLVEGARLKLGMKIQTSEGQDYFTMGNVILPGPDEWVRESYMDEQKREMVAEMHRTGGLGSVEKVNEMYYKAHPEKRPKKK